LKWLLDTPLNDFTSGRVFEYLWHVIFGREPVFCPEMDQCYRDLYKTSLPSLQNEEINTSSNKSSRFTQNLMVFLFNPQLLMNRNSR